MTDGLYKNNFSRWITVKGGMIVKMDYYGDMFAQYRPTPDAPKVGDKATPEKMKYYKKVL